MVRPLSCLALLAAVTLAGCLGADEAPSTTADPEPLVEGLAGLVPRIQIVDEQRWSGEPSILLLDDGTLLITGVGGMTRYVEDPSDIPQRFGQSYLWRSMDDGATWHFVGPTVLPHPADAMLPYRNAVLGVEGDLAKDESGNAYFVDLTALAANGLSTSSDSGATWTDVQNPLVGLPGTDRPWVAAFGDGQVYVKYLQMGTGHRVARSTDGGLTFLEDITIDTCGQADMNVDFERDEVLIPCAVGTEVSVLRTGAGAMAWERLPVTTTEGPVRGGFPALGVAGPGEYVIVWVEDHGKGMRTRLSASLDAGATWSPPITLSADNKTAIFPWVDANPDGVIGAVWYEAAEWGDPNTIETSWTVQHASLRIDRAAGALTGPLVVQVGNESVHEGSICNAGLGCVTGGRADDRRLLDFFEIDVGPDGRSHVTWTSTRTAVPTVWYGQVVAEATP